MRRRAFLTVLGGAASWPLCVRAQQPAMPVIGLVGATSARGWAPLMAVFRQGLGETGHIEGRNVTIEARWAEGEYERLPALVADLVQRRVSVIAAFTTPAALAAKPVTTTVPIVFTIQSDPVQVGLVASLSRPGGNLTGTTYLALEVGPKLLELLHEAVPAATTIALLVNPTNPNAETLQRNLHAAASTMGINLHVAWASTDDDLDAVFADLVRLRAGGLMIGSDPFLNTRNGQIAALALRHGLPSIYQARTFAAAGGLMSYGGNAADAYHQAGIYTGRILKGEKPADLPVQRSTRVELVINLRTAKALGMAVPLALLGRADEVIE